MVSRFDLTNKSSSMPGELYLHDSIRKRNISSMNSESAVESPLLMEEEKIGVLLLNLGGPETLCDANSLKMVPDAKHVPANVYVGMRYWHPFTEEAFSRQVLCARFPESWDRANLGIFSVFSFDLVSQIVPFCFYINIELWLSMTKLNKLCFPTLALQPVLAGCPFGQRVLMLSNLHLVILALCSAVI
ncbi:hypothetical protein LguiB_028011 [Lonicera macranthoides]